jgi:hypothetical protein
MACGEALGHHVCLWAIEWGTNSTTPGLGAPGPLQCSLSELSDHDLVVKLSKCLFRRMFEWHRSQSLGLLRSSNCHVQRRRHGIITVCVRAEDTVHMPSDGS